MDFKRRVAEALDSWEEKAPAGWADSEVDTNTADLFDPAFLEELANVRMPFGKYGGRLLLDLPEAYLLWFERQGYPEGRLGRQLQAMRELKTSSMEAFLRPLVRQ